MVKLIILNITRDRWVYPDLYGNFFGIKDYVNYFPDENNFPSKREIKQCNMVFIPGSSMYIHKKIPYRNKIYKILDYARKYDKLLVGFCYGHQLICKYLGGKIGILETPFIGAKGLVLSSYGKKLIGRSYILTWCYHTNYVSDIDGTELVSLCRFSNDFCISHNSEGLIKIVTLQYHPEFRFKLGKSELDLLPNRGRDSYIKYNKTIRKKLQECILTNCNGLNLSLDAFFKNYISNRENINKIYYMYECSKIIRKFLYNLNLNITRIK